MKVACLWFEAAAPTSKIAELFLRFSPQICLRKERAIFIEIGKCQKLYSEQSFLARAGILLRRSGHQARIQIGSDITDSLALNRFQKKTVDELPLEALLDFADPFDRDEVLRKSVQKMIHSFQDLGIQSMGQFKRLPAHELISRFGIVGRHCHNRVHAKEFLAWPSWSPEEIIREKKEFPYFEFYGELDPILFELKSQLDRIFARLFARRKKVMKLQVQLKCEKTSMNPDWLRTFDFDFFVPQGSSKGTLRILKERLSRDFERRPIRSPIESIQTLVLKTVHFEFGQKNIFNSDEEKFEQLHSLHNQLVELIGKENTYQAELTQDRRPEKSWQKKFDSPHEAGRDLSKVLEKIPERATYLCRQPIPIEVTAGFVHIRKRRYRILHWDNEIEKISGGWFESPVVETKDSFDRNYFNVEIEGNQRISVFETPARQFYLHGFYG